MLYSCYIHINFVYEPEVLYELYKITHFLFVYYSKTKWLSELENSCDSFFKSSSGILHIRSIIYQHIEYIICILIYMHAYIYNMYMRGGSFRIKK